MSRAPYVLYGVKYIDLVPLAPLPKVDLIIKLDSIKQERDTAYEEIELMQEEMIEKEFEGHKLESERDIAQDEKGNLEASGSHLDSNNPP